MSARRTARPSFGAAGFTPAALLMVLAAGPASRFHEDFDGPRLHQQRWAVTRQGDCQESTVEVADGRLRLRMATIGTRDDTVKFHGVRTKQTFDLSCGVAVSFELDWNDQANGCYLIAGVYLCPTATEENPRDERNWLKFEYIGVPPGRNARALLAVKRNGHLRHIYTEGWPEKQRTGRKIGRQRVRIVLQGPLVQVWERGSGTDPGGSQSDPHGKLLFEGVRQMLAFERAYLYLQMSSHSNYPAREVFFDDVGLEALSSPR